MNQRSKEIVIKGYDVSLYALVDEIYCRKYRTDTGIVLTPFYPPGIEYCTGRGNTPDEATSRVMWRVIDTIERGKKNLINLTPEEKSKLRVMAGLFGDGRAFQ